MPCRRLPRLGRTNELIVALDMNDISGLALLADRLLEPVHCGGGKGRRRTPRLPHPAIRMVPVANHGIVVDVHIFVGVVALVVQDSVHIGRVDVPRVKLPPTHNPARGLEEAASRGTGETRRVVLPRMALAEHWSRSGTARRRGGGGIGHPGAMEGVDAWSMRGSALRHANVNPPPGMGMTR